MLKLHWGSSESKVSPLGQIVVDKLFLKWSEKYKICDLNGFKAYILDDRFYSSCFQVFENI